ncbi:MAG TPA: LOG family protein [Gemmatimonadales bacterium]
MRAILRSQSYVEADQDVAFLDRPEVRGLRLQIDYAKAELLLEEHGIQSTIVVLGSTRIPEPDEARRRVNALAKALKKDTHNGELARRLAIAERVLAKSDYYESAREFARLVSAGSDELPEYRPVILTVGGPGLMEAANRGAADAGAKSIGLNITLPHEQYPNPYITPELCFRFHYFAVRKMHLLLRATALVAFPGGYGTLDELFETLGLVQASKIEPLPIVLVGESYWRKALNFEFLVDEGVIDTEDLGLFWFAETAQETWDSIVRWRLRQRTRGDGRPASGRMSTVNGKVVE